MATKQDTSANLTTSSGGSSNQIWRRLNPVWRLTVWYTIILMVLGVLFSTIVYELARNEIHDSVFPPRRGGEEIGRIFIENDKVFQTRNRLYSDSINRLMSSLVLFNLGVLTIGSGCSYLLAKRTLKPVEEALESQARFSSDAAHELRTPLAVMKSEIEVELRRSAASKSSHRQLLESNLEEVNRLEQMTENLLMLASAEGIEQKTAQPISQLFQSTVNNLTSVADQKNIALVFEPTNLEVTGDAVSLVNALSILVDNAIKYSPAATTVNLVASADGHDRILSVKDEGEGIAAEDINHIFERFYRADSSRSKLSVEGNGLGLSIASRIAKLHGGYIEVSSNKQKGSTFSIILPE